MAEFSELVRIKKRMCKEFGRGTCKGCPLLRQGCGIIAILEHSDYEFKELEDTLLSWAAEHPEPVYPTWLEWLTDVGAIPKVIGWDEPLVEAVYDAIQNPIPADIAQKLEIHPKEGV